MGWVRALSGTDWDFISLLVVTYAVETVRAVRKGETLTMDYGPNRCVCVCGGGASMMVGLYISVNLV